MNVRKMFRLGYNTNGFNCHSLESALEIISDLGYRGVALTLDNYILNPGAADLERQVERTNAMIRKKSLSCDWEDLGPVDWTHGISMNRP